MKTLIKKLQEIAEIHAITGGRNGYPVPELGLAIIPNSREDFEKIQEIIGKRDIYSFHTRNGWSFVESQRRFNDNCYSLSSDDFGDNYELISIAEDEKTYDVAFDWFITNWGYESVNEKAKGENMNVSEIYKQISEMSKELMSGKINLYRNGDGVEEYFDLDLFNYSHDTHTYMLGFFLDKDDENDYEIYQAYYE